MSPLDLDIQTIIYLLVIGDVAIIAILLIYLRGSAPDRPTRRLLAGKALQSIAWVLLNLRGSLSDGLSVYAGNVILILGLSLEALALASVGKREGRFDLAFAAIAAAGSIAFCALAGNPGGRAISGSLAPLAVFAALAAAMLEKEGRTPLRAGIGACCVVFALMLVVRAWTALAQGPDFGLKTPATIQSIGYVMVYLFILIGGIGYILLLKERADAELRENEEKYRTLVESAGEAIVIVQDERLAFANRRMGELAGFSPAALVGRPIKPMIWPEDRGLIMANYRERMEKGGASETYVFRIVGPGGEPLWMSLCAAAMAWKGRPAILGLLTDVSERKRAEDRVASLLAEKETLLKEVHHRVKNNLAVAASLLTLQEGSGGDPASVLRDARNRLQALVQLYDRLNAKGGYGDIKLRDYLPKLLGEVAAVFPSAAGLKFSVDLDDSALDAERLSRLGIMVNEIVTNSLKHAFAKTPRPAIRLSAASLDGRLVLVCADNGPGLPAGLEPGNSPGFGLRLIAMLAEQLDATLTVERAKGASFRVELELSPGASRSRSPGTGPSAGCPPEPAPAPPRTSGDRPSP